MEYAFIFLAGLLFGVLGTIAVAKFRFRSDGCLRIDRSDPDGPYLFLELSNAVDITSKKRFVVFDVVDKNYISHR